MLIAALIASQVPVPPLRVRVGNGSEALVRVVDDRSSGYRLKVDCVKRCGRPLHHSAPVGDTPMSLVDLHRDGLVYSSWGTGCCYLARVLKVTAAGVVTLFERGSREVPSLITSPALTVVTYVRPTDGSGRETSMTAKPVRWTYRHGRFERS